jgi:hypothetical protein
LIEKKKKPVSRLRRKTGFFSLASARAFTTPPPYFVRGRSCVFTGKITRRARGTIRNFYAKRNPGSRYNFRKYDEQIPQRRTKNAGEDVADGGDGQMDAVNSRRAYLVA